MNVLKREKQIAAISMLVEGCSLRSVSRITGIHRDTIGRLLDSAASHCRLLWKEHLREIECDSIQADEIWCFVGKKQAHVKKGDPAEFGDQYTYVAFDPVTKLVASFVVGKRNEWTTQRFMDDLSSRIRGRLHLCTDGFGCYPDAVRASLGDRVDYAQVIKTFYGTVGEDRRYSPAKIAHVSCRSVFGFPRKDLVSTSLVERQNLTMRMQIRRFTRLTNGFSKKLARLRSALTLHFTWYNFVRLHGSLGMTPAMAARITPTFWSIDRLLPNGWEPRSPRKRKAAG